MTRRLASFAVLCIAGCTCFDDKYREYCDASTKCRGLESPIGRVRFDPPLPDPVDAFTCYPLLLELTLADGGLPAPFPPTRVGFTTTPADAFEVFDAPDCDGGSQTQLVATVGKPQLSFRTRRFGNVELRVDVDAPGSDGDDADLLSQAAFTWSPAGYYVPPGDCRTSGVSAKLQATAASDDTQAVPASEARLFAVEVGSGFTALDLDGGCSERPQVFFDAGVFTVELRLGTNMPVAPRLLRFNAQEGSVTGTATANLDHTCAPLSAACGATGCCGEGSCAFGTGFCAADSGHPCNNASDCWSFSCNVVCQ